MRQIRQVAEIHDWAKFTWRERLRLAWWLFRYGGWMLAFNVETRQLEAFPLKPAVRKELDAAKAYFDQRRAEEMAAESGVSYINARKDRVQ